jgi:hypothetical protein
MWLLTILPVLFIHLIFASGVVLVAASFLLRMIPFIYSYTTLIRIIGFLLLGTGLYLQGGLASKEEQAIRVAKLEVQLAAARTKAAKANVEVVTRYVTETQVVTKKGDTVIKYIRDNAPAIDGECTISPDVVHAHNLAAELSSDSEPDKP